MALANAFLLVFASLPVVEPLLRALGATSQAASIFSGYSWVCHQLPSRSYELFGNQMAWCERNTALYGAMAIGGLLWAKYGQRLPRLHWLLFLALLVPIALDGFTQLAALRESTWQLRTITGGLAGMAAVWFAYPILKQNFEM